MFFRPLLVKLQLYFWSGTSGNGLLSLLAFGPMLSSGIHKIRLVAERGMILYALFYPGVVYSMKFPSQ